jgi:hypothetical protein
MAYYPNFKSALSFLSRKRVTRKNLVFSGNFMQFRDIPMGYFEQSQMDDELFQA